MGVSPQPLPLPLLVVLALMPFFVAYEVAAGNLFIAALGLVGLVGCVSRSQLGRSALWLVAFIEIVLGLFTAIGVYSSRDIAPIEAEMFVEPAVRVATWLSVILVVMRRDVDAWLAREPLR